jgi:hypothetical protein
MVPKPVPVQTVSDPDHNFTVTRKCLSCGDEKVSTVTDSNLINGAYESMIDAHYGEIKSPFEVELKFLSIKLDKKTMMKSPLGGNNVVNKHGMPAFFAYCEDRSGLLYRFGGMSAMKVIYGAVKGRWFNTRICVQKFVRTNKGSKPWSMGIGNEDTIQHWRQAPKILDEITLI